MNDYGFWYGEIYPFEIGFEITRKLAAHLAVRVMSGNAVVLTDTPHNLLPVLCKRWNAILRTLEQEQAAAHGVTKAELKAYARTLEGIPFMVEQPDERVTSTVWLFSPDDFSRVPVGIMTIYVMSENISMSQVMFWVRQMKDGSALVIFRKQPLTLSPNR